MNRTSGLISVLSLGVATLGAIGLTRLTLLMQVRLSPILVFWMLLLVLGLVLVWGFVMPLRGLVMRHLAATPQISLARLAQTQATQVDHCLKTMDGFQAFFEIALPQLEAHVTDRPTLPLIQLLTNHGAYPAIFFPSSRETPQPLRYSFVTQSALATFFGYVNAANHRKGRAPMRLQCALRVPNPDIADRIAQHEGIEPIPPDQWAAPFGFGQKTHSGACAAQVPAILSTDGKRFMPLLVEDLKDEMGWRSYHDVLGHLSSIAQCPVLMETKTTPVTRGELRRIKFLNGIEQALPAHLFAEEAEVAAQDEGIRLFEADLKGPVKPQMVAQILWFQLSHDQDAQLILEKIRHYLPDFQVRHMMPTECLAAYAALYPGLGHLGIQPFMKLAFKEELARWLASVDYWPGHPGPPLILLRDTLGRAVPFNFFHGQKFNGLVIGKSGGGKTFTCCALAAAHLAEAEDNRLILVDYGGCFSALCHAAGGLEISYAHRSAFRFSPFPILDPPLDQDALPAGLDYQEYLANHDLNQGHMIAQSLFLVCQFCGIQEPSAVFRAHYHHWLMGHAQSGVPVLKILEGGRSYIQDQRTQQTS